MHDSRLKTVPSGLTMSGIVGTRKVCHLNLESGYSGGLNGKYPNMKEDKTNSFPFILVILIQL